MRCGQPKLAVRCWVASGKVQQTFEHISEVALTPRKRAWLLL